MSNLQTHYHFELDFQKVDKHTKGKWLIHSTKNAKTISCKAWKSPVEYPSRESKHDIKESEGNNIQRECPGAETSREVSIYRTRTNVT